MRPDARRRVRVAAAMAGVGGVLALAGCATATTSEAGSASGGAGGLSQSTYKDGTYSASGTYQTPQSVEKIDVTIGLRRDVVTSVRITSRPTLAETQQYQSQFSGGIAAIVVGQDIDRLDVSRVAGSSLTSAGFNAAIAEIKSEAAR
jgi:uncharacterized protein with FMN-binding domain